MRGGWASEVGSMSQVMTPRKQYNPKIIDMVRSIAQILLHTFEGGAKLSQPSQAQAKPNPGWVTLNMTKINRNKINDGHKLLTMFQSI